MKSKIAHRKPAARRAAGVTLPEVLIAIFVLGIGIMAVTSLVFIAGHFGRQAVRHTEAARIARAVANYLETMDGPWWDRFAPPPASFVEIVSRKDSSWSPRWPVTNPDSSWPKDLRPNYTNRPAPKRDGEPLVWYCMIRRLQVQTNIYQLDITVYADADADEELDLYLPIPADPQIPLKPKEPKIKTFVTQIIRPE